MTVVERIAGQKTERRRARRHRTCEYLSCRRDINPGDVYLVHTAFPGSEGMEGSTGPCSIAECPNCAAGNGRAHLLDRT